MRMTFRKLVAAILGSDDHDTAAAYERRILAEYKNKRHLYEEFGVAVYKLLDLFLKEGNFRYQLAYRTKAPEGLREKLVRKATQGIWYEHLDDIEDLAGLRVVFYSDKSKSRFLSAIRDEISGTMRFEERTSKSGYDATHVVVSFGPKRLELSEYKHFKGMKSEIQVTTILRHAWAEIEHDLVYKDISGLRKRDPEKFAMVQVRLGRIMTEHIKQASSELEELLNEIDE
ncbi:MAG: hypothetical protein KAX84_19660 [Burkholderiales bacterium]|nr:hypothetical protein [Burkholderiales bacterium]